MTSKFSDLKGYDAVIHLAALSNDPLSDLNPGLTFDINHEASVQLARLAKDAGRETVSFFLLLQHIRGIAETRC